MQLSRRLMYLIIPFTLVMLATACGDDSQNTQASEDAEADPTETQAPEDAEADPTETQDAEEREPVTLTLLTAQPEDVMQNEGMWIFRDMLEEAAPWITIDYRGGPEVVPGAEAIEAVANGAFDMVVMTPSYYPQIMPAAHAMLLRTKMPWEEREDGSEELIKEFHEEIGIYHLGTVETGYGFQLYFGRRGAELDLENLSLAGFTMRSPPAYLPLVEALGASVVQMPFSDVFTAIERGVIDGTGSAQVGIYELGIGDVVEYELRPAFNRNTQCLCLNLEVWNSLDPRTQEVLTEVMIEAERAIAEHYAGLVEVEEKRREDDDRIQIIELQGAARDEFLQLAADAAWETALSEEPRVEELRSRWQE